LAKTIVALEKVASGGKSFHTIPITHGILKGGPLDGDPPNEEDGRPSCGGLRNDGPPKSFQHVSYPNWYVRPIAPTPHMIWKFFLYPIYNEGTDLDVHVRVFQKAINANGKKDDANIIILFYFTLCDTILEWEENLLQSKIVVLWSWGMFFTNDIKLFK